MAKKMKKTMAMLLVLCMMASMMSVSAFAADGTVVENTTTTEFGVPTDVTTTTTTATDENGKVTVTVTVEKTADDVDANGVEIKAEETRVETTVTDKDGNVIANDWRVDGSETKEWTEEDNGDEVGQPEVEVVLKPGETTTGSATTTETVTNADGSVTTTTTTERVVEATATENEAKVEVAGTSEMKPIIPDRTIMDDGDLKDEQLLKEYTYSGGFEDNAPVAAPEGYDYRFTGFGQMSMYGNAIITGNGTEGRTGALQFIVEYDPFFDPSGSDNKVVADDEKFVGYCADIDTSGIDNFWYRIDSLEDAGYYDEEAAKYIRAIALNGYWGTADKDENGDLQVGSLAKLKADMIAAVQAGTLTGITEEEISSITQGQAVNATQSAIWMYANESTNGSHVDPDRMITKGYAANKSERVDPSAQDIANAKAIFNYLMALAPMEKSDNMEIIDQDAFIKDDSMSLTIGDKLSGNEANADENKDNDVYEASLNFALVVTPTNGDDLVVQIITGFDADGNAIIAAQGRIAGGNAEEDAANGFHEVVYDEATGTYTLKNLALAENSDFDFDLKLVGTQYLEHGVYIFTSENRNGTTSQTFVSVLEGEKEVNVSKGYTIRFNVDEDNQVVAQRVWHDEADPEVAPNHGVFALAVHRPLENIPEEEVPLADAPQTGDEAIIFAALTLLAGMSLMAMHVSEQKRKEEV